MKSRYFNQSAGADAIKPFKSSANGFHCVYFEHSASSCAAVKQRFTHRCSGFTLLEVMVALAIFATAAMALTKVAIQYTQSTSHAILRTKAQFVALNEAAQMEINQEWLTGTSSRQSTQQGELWQIDKKAEATISPNVQRIDIQISSVNADSGQVESGVSSLVFFNHRVNQTQ